MMTSRPSVLVLIAASTGWVGTVQAAVRLPGLFSDHMVLQRDLPVPVWGTASANERVTVAIGERKASATADASGHWRVRLEPLRAGGPFELTIAGNNTITLRDVMIGEVWLCSGQSNMGVPVKIAANGSQETAAGNHPMIRLFTVPRLTASQPQSGVDAAWKVCTPATVGDFSAVGYYFGRDLQKTYDVPVGLIHASWGGTPAEAWTARTTLEADSDLKEILKLKRVAAEPMQNGRGTTRAGGAVKSRPDNRPASAPAQRATGDPVRPSFLYNGMIHPLIPCAIRGVIWYQGEANSTRAYAYRKVLPAMICNWRADWGQGDFPFLIVQLANCLRRQAEPFASDWAELREAQLMTLSQPKTALAVTIDIGDPNDVHPKNKQEVGRRLALAARAIAYGEVIPYSGPIYASHVIEGDKVRVRFKHTDGGLAIRDGRQLAGFGVAGEDQHFVDATATIEGNEIIVSSEQVKRPVAVRYAWADSPECNLVNGAGLPASPFRTDDWPGITAGRK